MDGERDESADTGDWAPVVCPHCRELLPAPREQIGQSLPCDRCGFDFSRAIDAGAVREAVAARMTASGGNRAALESALALARECLDRLPDDSPSPVAATALPRDAFAARRDETTRRLVESARSLGSLLRTLALVGALLGTLIGLLAIIPSKGVSLVFLIAGWISFAVLRSFGDWIEAVSAVLLRLCDAARKGASK